MDINKEREDFEQHLSDTGLVEFEDDAARAYDKEAMHLFGEYAKLNFKQATVEAQEQSHDSN